MKKSEESLWDLWEATKWVNLQIVSLRIPEEVEKKKGEESFLKNSDKKLPKSRERNKQRDPWFPKNPR